MLIFNGIYNKEKAVIHGIQPETGLSMWAVSAALTVIDICQSSRVKRTTTGDRRPHRDENAIERVAYLPPAIKRLVSAILPADWLAVSASRPGIVRIFSHAAIAAG